MRTTTEAAKLQAWIAAAAQPAPLAPKAERLRSLAKTQRREGIAGIRRLRKERRWIADVSQVQPGVGLFYGVPHSAEVRADVASYALSCRRRANEAAAEARALEAAATMMKAA